jgi:hypothetical protein
MIYNDIQEYVALKPRYYRFLKAINFSRKISNEKCYGYDVEILLSKCSSEDDADLRIQCTNAFDIKINNIEGMLGLLVDIEDVKGKQIESGNYRILEQEEDAFSFYCEDFFVELIR